MGHRVKRLWSIFTLDMDHCMFTGSPYVERHHVFSGPNKRASERRGFIAPLRYDLHPNGTRFDPTPENKKIDQILKQNCQAYYEAHYGSREEFIKEFGKSYL